MSDGDRLIGMITDRDIAIRGAAERKGVDTSVRDVMTNEIECVFEDDDLDEVSV